MFELLLDVMERTCEMPGCLGKNCMVGAKWHNINVKRFTAAITSNPIGAHTDTDNTVPYGTALWGGAAPGTSCQATIVLSLRDISQQALASLTRQPVRAMQTKAHWLALLIHGLLSVAGLPSALREASVADRD